MCECGAAIVLQWAEQRIGTDLIAGTIQITAAVVTADVVAVGCDAAATEDVFRDASI